MSRETCPTCGEDFKQIGGHWRYSPDHRPELTGRQHNIIRGLMMGDGSVRRREGGRYPRMDVRCIVPQYLEHLSNEFGILGCEPRLHRTAAEAASNNRESGFSPNAEAENYSDIHLWRMRAHPEMGQYSDWYETDKKVWPEDLELTPETLTHWFAGDGSNCEDYTSIVLAMENERGNQRKVERYFERAGLPAPDRWNLNGAFYAAWNKDASIELFDYMESPPPGYEYKWPEEVR